MFRKNTASQFIHFQGVDSSTGGIKSGVSWTVRRCIDGTFAAATGTVTEDGTAGWYKFAMSQADTNGNNIGFNFTGTGAVPQTVNIVTTDLNPYDSVRYGMTALPNAAAGANTGLPVVGTQVPNATAGASAGLLISGSNSGTTTLGALTVTGATTLTGNVQMSDGLTIPAPSTGNRSGITVTGNGTGHGVSITSGNGATGDGLRAAAASTNGNGVTGVKTGSGSDLNTTSTPLTLAKTTNITGFNDIAATAVVSSGAITTSGGAVTTVTSVSNDVGITQAGADKVWGSATRTLTAFSTALALSVWDVLTANILTASSIGIKLKNWALGTDNRALVSADAHASGQTVAAVTGAVGSVTGAVGSVTGAVGSVTAAVTVGTNNDKTGYSVGTGGIDAAAFAAGAIDAAAVAANAIGASELGQDAAQEVADEVLNRNIAGGGSGGARIVRDAFRLLRNKSSIAGGTLTVTQENDTTAAWTAAVTTAAGNPIDSIDPA